LRHSLQRFVHFALKLQATNEESYLITSFAL